MILEEINKLEELAKKATPGPWDHVKTGGTAVWEYKDGSAHVLPDHCFDFIAASNPETILKLCKIAKAVIDLRAAVDEQAKDEGLWFNAATAPEAYLQQELRKLHALIEGDK